MERVELLLQLILALSLCYSSVESRGDHFVGKLMGRCNSEERDALLKFKRSLLDVNHNLSEWDINEDCCTWKVVDCDNTTGNVIKLDFSRMKSIGVFEVLEATTFDSSLFRLQHLQYLCLHGLYFRTTIPQSISSLTNLYHLDLFFTGFVGVIPPQIGNLTKLRYLDLSLNDLAASNLLWMSHLSSLQYLDMSEVNLSLANKWLQEIQILPSLSILNLDSCNLKTLPTLLQYPNFTSTIMSFDLSYNQFENSTVPAWLCNMTNLVLLYLDDCQLQGVISNNSLATLTKLTDFDLSNNRLSGSIPCSLGQLSKLIYLNLNDNQLIGSLSDVHFINLSQLEFLDLSNNHLGFNMMSPNWVPPFQAQYISLRSCSIGPNFPSWLKTQKFLRALDLSNSNIFDTIPSWFLNIFSQVSYLNMSYNAIRGEFPLSFTSKALVIDLSSNQFKGYLPRLTSSMIVAFFSNNKFSKGIERYLNAKMSSLEALDLSHNHLHGKIPGSICQMTSIYVLHLSHNNLSGEIPKCSIQISIDMNLVFIGLANNNFSGLIPQWLGNQPMLLSLYLSNNNFHGEIPFFENTRKLITLDLGQNNLTGIIPSWIGENLSSLKILCLRSNKFYGSIPSNLSKLKALQILYLADNCLSGSLPKSLKFLDSMAIQSKRLEPLSYGNIDFANQVVAIDIDIDYPTILDDVNLLDSLIIDTNGVYREVTKILDLEIIMDLSCNNLTGEIPIELMSLIGLRCLNLSNNQFTGHIPLNIDALQSIEILDLSRNNFSGEIPESMVKLNKLSYLNLSYNQLSGRIPAGTQLDSFNDSSYFGNPELCGKPLIKACEDDEHDIYNGGSNSHDDDDGDFGLFFGMGLGFAFGLWSVLGILLLKKSWAIAYFQLYHNIIDNIYVFVVVKVNRWFNR